VIQLTTSRRARSYSGRVPHPWSLRVRALIFPVLPFLVFGALASAQTPSPVLLVLEKADSTLAFVDPGTLKIVGRVPAGPDPHEIEASPDGKFAYISNYGGSDSTLHTISVVDVEAQKPLTPIDLGALHSAHGLAWGGGKLYFTAETNKVVGRYDPETHAIDWVIGTGQDRTHMVWVDKTLDRIVTSNVNSGTISIIEQVNQRGPGGPPATPPGAVPGVTAPSAPSGQVAFSGGPRKTWEVTNVTSGRGSEGFDVSPDGKEIWAANAQDATVTVIDISSKRATQTFPISVKGANRLKFTLDGKHAFVAGLGGGSGNVAIVDAASRKEIKHLDLGGGSAGILMVPGGSRAFIAVSGANKVAAIDLTTMEVTGYIQTGKGPDGLAWAERK
jgi:DNA-binding beta-propeller fold protein YncE